MTYRVRIEMPVARYDKEYTEANEYVFRSENDMNRFVSLALNCSAKPAKTMVSITVEDGETLTDDVSEDGKDEYPI